MESSNTLEKEDEEYNCFEKCIIRIEDKISNVTIQIADRLGMKDLVHTAIFEEESDSALIANQDEQSKKLKMSATQLIKLI